MNQFLMGALSFRLELLDLMPVSGGESRQERHFLIVLWSKMYQESLVTATLHPPISKHFLSSFDLKDVEYIGQTVRDRQSRLTPLRQPRLETMNLDGAMPGFCR